ncbi:MAG TPA: PIG-L deacetylase family protein [archaeon]|nr:PIG-L deacetylase family protein [archaeon]
MLKKLIQFNHASFLGLVLSVFLLQAVRSHNPALGAQVGTEPLRVIMVGAHPDDAEFKGGGTAALWVAAGARVQFVAVANGDCGHQSQGGGALARRRAAESRRSAEILGVSWITLDIHDGEIMPSLDAREAVMRAIRNWRADIVISHRTNDYHPDHRYTGQLVQDVAYMAAVPNLCPDTPRLEKNPVFMYFLDNFKKPNPFTADVAVIIDPVMDKKWRSLDAMESQMYEWLPWVAGNLDKVPEGRAARFEWLKKEREGAFAQWKNSGLDILVERYGKTGAGKAKFVECFELCEYGRRPNREELWKMFPK